MKSIGRHCYRYMLVVIDGTEIPMKEILSIKREKTDD